MSDGAYASLNLGPLSGDDRELVQGEPAASL